MAAYAALVSLLNNIQQIKNHPTLSNSLNNKHIQPLLEKIGFLLDFVEGNTYGGGSKEAQDLERKITSAAHAAEDLIESHVVDQIHEASRVWPPYLLIVLLKCVGCHLSDGSEESLDLQQINEDMDSIMEEANWIKEKSRSGEEEKPTDLAEPLMQSGETAMVGLDAELIQLLDELTGYQSSRRIISIVGMGGIGKTTLAKNVYENLHIKEKFQFRAWAAISQQNNAKEVLSKLLSGLGELSSGTVDNLEVDELGVRLHKTLSGRRYLIILDDIWSVKAWDEVKRYFPDNNNGSRILLTTRLSNVAKDCGSSLFMMNLLDEQNSWKLFREKAIQGEHCPPELLEVGKKIVELCKGLALSIVVIGGVLLKSPATVGYWWKVANELKSISSSEEIEQCLDVLSLSYHHLPSHLKPCFLYMGVFKDDSQTRVSKIIKLWIAEGFIKSIGSRVLEEIAEGYVNDLIDRNLVLVGRRRKNGKVGSCGIHDLLRDLCIKLAEQQELFHQSDGEIRGTERRLVYCTYKRWTKLRLPLVRSIVGCGSIKEVTKYRLLRVLDEGGYYSEVDYKPNVNLRYLALNHVDGSPQKLLTSVSYMWNLQTLIINEFSVLFLPIEFWKIRQIRHVDCYRIYSLGPPPSNEQDGFLILENLLTLKTVLNLRLSEEICRIIPNIKKLYLEYGTLWLNYDDSLIECLCNLDRLHKLESLKLRINIESGRFPFLDRELKIKLITSFPSSLKKLSLRDCQLHWDDMAIIGSLPLLEVLYLEASSFLAGRKWSPVDGQFRRLKYLKIACSMLYCWDVEKSHFPVLEKLLLNDLTILREISLDIGDIPTLELIHMDNCSVSAAISAVKIKEENLENEGQLQVQVRMYEAYVGSFNQKLKTEGLTTDNIHLEIWG